MPKLKTDFSNLRGGIDLYIGIENNKTSEGMVITELSTSGSWVDNKSFSDIISSPIHAVGIKEGLKVSNEETNPAIARIIDVNNARALMDFYGNNSSHLQAYIRSVPNISIMFTHGAINVVSIPLKLEGFTPNVSITPETVTDNVYLSKVVVS